MALITLSDTKTYLGITSSDYDTLLNMFIGQISAEIETYLDRQLEEQEYASEVLKFVYSNNDAQNNPLLDVRGQRPQCFTKEYPISSSPAPAITQDGDSVDTDDYYIDYDEGVINWNRGVSDADNKLLITYTAGYATIPDDIQAVAMEGVKQAFNNSGSASQGSGNVKSKKVGDFSVSYGSTESYVTEGGVKRYLAEGKSTLDRYKRAIV